MAGTLNFDRFNLGGKGAKGQLLSKANSQAMNSFLLPCDVFSFVFLEEIDDTEKTF